MKDLTLGGVYLNENGVTTMKRYLVVCLIPALIAPAFGQQPPPGGSTPLPAAPPGNSFSDRLRALNSDASAANANLPRCDLDFPGGTPRELVKAIEKASGKPLNAVIREEDAGLRLAAVSVKSVSVPQLFSALIQVSTEDQAVQSGFTSFGGGRAGGGEANYRFVTTSYGFKTEGAPTENSIWYFYHTKATGMPEAKRPVACRFYQLGPYLDANYKVEDITTAVETGWKMLGDKNPPKLSYHKDTKLLIAVGDTRSLDMIGEVLQQLTPVGVQSGPARSTPARATGQ